MKYPILILGAISSLLITKSITQLSSPPSAADLQLIEMAALLESEEAPSFSLLDTLMVGDYVWLDENENGMQEPDEPPIPFVKIKLYGTATSGEMELIATTSTDANGKYYFSCATSPTEVWEQGYQGLVEGEPYSIVVTGDMYDQSESAIMVGGEAYIFTKADVVSGPNPDEMDSDGIMKEMPGMGVMPVLTLVTNKRIDLTRDVGLLTKKTNTVAVRDLSVKLSADQSKPIAFGELVRFEAQVKNEGNTTLDNIELKGIQGNGLKFVENEVNKRAGWRQGEKGELNLVSAEPLMPGMIRKIPLVMQLQEDKEADELSYQQSVEAIKFRDPAVPDQEVKDADGEETGDNIGIERIAVDELAVRVTANLKEAVRYKSVVPFSVDLTNLGVRQLQNVKLKSLIGDGLKFVDNEANTRAGWTLDKEGAITLTGKEELAAGGVRSIPLQLQVQEVATPKESSWTNSLEVVSYIDAANSRELIVGTGRAAKKIAVRDLSVKLMADQSKPIAFGELVRFESQVKNEGNTPLDNIELEGIQGKGLRFLQNETNTKAGWSQGKEGQLNLLSAEPLLPGAIRTIPLVMQLQEVSEADELTYQQSIEAVKFRDPAVPEEEVKDIDSEETRDNIGIEKIAMDELAVRVTATLKEALKFKAVVPFSVELKNMGVRQLQNVKLKSLVGQGLKFVDNEANTRAGWTVDKEGAISLTGKEELAAGANRTIPLQLQVQEVATPKENSWTNSLEVVSYVDAANPRELIEGTGKSAKRIAVRDLSVKLTADQSKPIAFGELVRFEAQVTNEGNTTLDNIELKGIQGKGLRFVENDVNTRAGWSQGKEDQLNLVSADPLLPGAIRTIPLVMQLVEVEEADELTYQQSVEAVRFRDPAVPEEEVKDIDSEETQDNIGIEKIVTDELAVRVTAKLRETLKYKAVVPFSVELNNMGVRQLQNVKLKSLVDSGLKFVDSQENADAGWVQAADGSINLTSVRELVPGAVRSIPLQLQVLEIATPNVKSWTNSLEVVSFEDTANPNVPILGTGVDSEKISVRDISVDLVVGRSVPIEDGSVVPLEVEIKNEGNKPLTNLNLEGLHAEGLKFVRNETNTKAGWTQVKEGQLSLLSVEPLLPGEIRTIPLHVQFQKINFPNKKTWELSTEVLSFEDSESPGETVEDIDGAESRDNFDVENILPQPDLAVRFEVGPGFNLTELSYNEPVKFKATIFNQTVGPIDSVQLTTYLETGFTFDASMAQNDGWEEDANGHPTYVLARPINGEEKDSVCIYLTLEKVDDREDWLSVMEISKAWSNGEEVEDSDSPLNADPDDNVGSLVSTPADDFINGDGTATAPDGVADTDQDNVDPATVEICDLALTNKIVAAPSSPKVGDKVKYEVVVFNQGNTVANSVEVKYHIPNGLSYSSDNNALTPAWTEASDQMASITTEDVLQPGESDTLCIYLNIENAGSLATEDSWTTIAEIESYTNEADEKKTEDIDSDPDSDPENDSGGNPDDDTDNVTDGSGEGDPNNETEDTNPALDEDDHDPAKIEICDAALKVYTDETGPFRYQDTVKYKVVVYNQGNGDITNIKINNFYGSGMKNVSTFSNTEEGWSASIGNMATTYSMVLKSGESDTICLDMQIVSSLPFDKDAYVQVVEIESFESPEFPGISKSDLDSKPDDDPNNDPGGNPDDATDDEIDGDGSGDPGSVDRPDPSLDEDDNDPVEIEICDLALVNKLVTVPMNPIVGDTVKYEVIVYNQGNAVAGAVHINYLIPNGLGYLSVNDSHVPMWNYMSSTLTETVTDKYLLPGEQDTVCLYLEIMDLITSEVTEESWRTIAEITSFADEAGEQKTTDSDSTPDDDFTNDPGGNPFDATDNEVNGSGMGDASDPDEDSDPLLDEDDHDPADIYVCDVAAIIDTEDEGPYTYGQEIKYTVEVHNQGNGVVTNIQLQNLYGTGLKFLGTSSENISAGWVDEGQGELSLVLTDPIVPSEMVSICLKMEIMPDLMPSADTWLQNIEIVKFEDPNEPGVAKHDVDSTPDSDPDNDSGGDPDDETDDVLDGDGSGDADDPTEDADPELDEDDQDTENIEICDLALKNVISELPLTAKVGDSIKYEVIVYNQGNYDVNSVSLNYLVPNGLRYLPVNDSAMPSWSEVSSTLLEVTLEEVLSPGESDTLCLSLQIENVPTATATDDSWTTLAEITGYTDGDDEIKETDIDSTPDSDLGNDSGGNPDDDTDDVVDGDGTGDPADPNEDADPALDEDDHDSAKVEIYDVATIMYTENDGPHSYGDTVKYIVEIHNQGNGPIANIELQNLFGDGLEFLETTENYAVGWTIDGANDLSLYVRETIESGDILEACLTMEILSSLTPSYDTWLQTLEVVKFEDPKNIGEAKKDIDSTPDDNPDNDSGGNPDDTDNVTDGDGSGDPDDPSEDSDENLDEDDHDPVDIEICDVALSNAIVDLPSVIKEGDTIKYEVVLQNQGNDDVSKIAIDYLVPNGFDFLEANEQLSPAWTLKNDSIISIVSEEILAPGESDTLCVLLEVDNVETEEVTADSWTTIAEITEYENGDGETKVTDADSTPDEDLANDPGGNPDDETNDEMNGDGTGDQDDSSEDSDPELDEDDHDPEKIEVCDAAAIIYTDHEVPSAYYEEVKFNVEIHNQGNGPITKVLLQELHNEGWEFVSTPNNTAVGWTEESDGDLSILYDEVLELGEVDTVCLELKLLPDFDSDEESWLNFIEIVSFEDPDAPGEAKVDHDSQPDDDNTNDSGGNPSDDTNDETAGVGTGDPEDPSEDIDPDLDEDDQDAEDYKVFDLAVTIQIDSMPPVLPVVPGDMLKFNIVTTNQGNIDANNVLLSNYLMPGNLEVASMSSALGWSIIDNELSQLSLTQTLAPGAVDTTCIYLEVVNGGMADLITWVEISGSDETDDDCFDMDSTPDVNNSNDVGGTPESTEDNHIEDDGADGNTDGITDEDDHDPAQIFAQDLALIVWTDHKEPVKVGQDINFKVRVENQGNIENDKIKVVTYLPSGFMLSPNDDNNWVEESSDLLSLTLPTSLSMGEEIDTDLLLKVNAGATAETLIIYSEIASSVDENGMSLDDRDIDSTPDEYDSNDNGGEPQDPIDCNTVPTIIGNDNLMTGSGKNGEDEDDHDPAWVHVYDLATIIYTQHTQPIIPHDDIKFEVEIHNQGNMAAEDVMLSLYLPDGFALSTSDVDGWTVSGDNLLTRTHDKIVEPFTVDKTCLVLTVQPDYMLESLIPFVEITSAMDTLGHELTTCDLDSNADGDPGNDVGGFPDSSDDNMVDGSARMGEDEDDHDPVVPPVLDLALRIESTVDEPQEPGDLVKFVVTVYNQGSITPEEFTLENYIPNGLQFENILENRGWTLQGTDAVYNYTEPLLPFESDTLCIFLSVTEQAHPQNAVDMIEVIEVMDEYGNDVSSRDIDSEADDNNENDKGNDNYSVEASKIDENGRSGEDEDDHDQAFIVVCTDMTCLAQVNISLDQNCEAILTADMLMTGPLLPTEYYEFYISDGFGNFEQVTSLDIDDLGMHDFQVYNPICDDNACWGRMLVEYKHLPRIDCPDDLTLSCGALDVLPLPDVTGGGTCIATAFDIYLADEVRDKIECGEPGAEDYTHVVTRTYVATDDQGNSASCSHTIMVERINLTGVEFPGNACIQCSQLDDFILAESGVPIPWINAGLTGSGTAGVPVICMPFIHTTTGLVCPSTGSGTGVPLIPQTGGSVLTPDGPEIFLGDAVGNCSAAITYTDMVLPKIGCTSKVIRTWEIREWYCAAEIPIGPSVQLIEIKDDMAPVIECPAPFTITTNDDCAGDITLPPALANDGCGNGTHVTIEHPWGIVEGNGGIATLEVGTHILTYKVSDDCYNRTSCTTNVTVADNTEPVAICEQFTVVSISQDGNTFVSSDVFDDGSWDECGGVTSCAMKMADVLRFRAMTVDIVHQGVNYVERSRMDDGCLQDYVSGVTLNGIDYICEDDLCIPYVRFCCTDVGQDIMTIYRAKDHGGNTSDCMVTVEVQDKAIPSLVCPDNVTIDCRTTYDVDNLALQFGSPTILDNCANTQPLVEDVDATINQCGLGSIIRQFVINDSQGIVLRICKQEVSIINETPFVESSIEWPQDFESSCGTASQLLPEVLDVQNAFPVFTAGDDRCSLLGYDYEDQFFAGNPLTGECGAIRRSWTVIDWCNQVDGQFVTYPSVGAYVQTIKITNNSEPEILAQLDLTFSSNSTDCQSGTINVARTATDDCTSAGNLEWTYVLRNSNQDLVTTDADGVQLSGVGSTFSGTFISDSYNIEWSVCDSCGNCSSVTQIMELVNTKTPIPICLNGLSISLDNNGAAELWASDVNGGSYHPCGNEFTYGFDSDTNEQGLLFDCRHLGVQAINLYVRDTRSGTSDFCIATVEIQDPLDVCIPEQGLRVSGEVFTEELKYVEEVKIEMASNMSHEMTNSEGEYAFVDMPLGGNYSVTPEKNIEYLNGVSTLDLILIQRHILGLQELDSPYKLIAADVNGSNDINGIDLVELRKLILGVYKELPTNDSWRFVDTGYKFLDELDPWQEAIAEEYQIVNLSSDMDIDFIGVKIGDVNGSAETSNMDSKVESRSSRWPMILELEDRKINQGDITKVKVYGRNYEGVSGWQATFSFDPMMIEIVDVIGKSLAISKNNINYSSQDEGWMTMSYHNLDVETIGGDEILFELIVKAKEDLSTVDLFDLSSDVTDAEAYRGYSVVVPLELKAKKSQKNIILSSIPNPWIESTNIKFEIYNPGNVRFEFYDANGRLLHYQEAEYQVGQHTFSLDGNDIDIQGVIYIRLISVDDITEFKTIRL